MLVLTNEYVKGNRYVYLKYFSPIFHIFLYYFILFMSGPIHAVVLKVPMF